MKQAFSCSGVKLTSNQRCRQAWDKKKEPELICGVHRPNYQPISGVKNQKNNTGINVEKATFGQLES